MNAIRELEESRSLAIYLYIMFDVGLWINYVLNVRFRKKNKNTITGQGG